MRCCIDHTYVHVHQFTGVVLTEHVYWLTSVVLTLHVHWLTMLTGVVLKVHVHQLTSVVLTIHVHRLTGEYKNDMKKAHNMLCQTVLIIKVLGVHL